MKSKCVNLIWNPNSGLGGQLCIQALGRVVGSDGVFTATVLRIAGFLVKCLWQACGSAIFFCCLLTGENSLFQTHHLPKVWVFQSKEEAEQQHMMHALDLASIDSLRGWGGCPSMSSFPPWTSWTA